MDTRRKKIKGSAKNVEKKTSKKMRNGKRELRKEREKIRGGGSERLHESENGMKKNVKMTIRNQNLIKDNV